MSILQSIQNSIHIIEYRLHFDIIVCASELIVNVKSGLTPESNFWDNFER